METHAGGLPRTPPSRPGSVGCQRSESPTSSPSQLKLLTTVGLPGEASGGVRRQAAQHRAFSVCCSSVRQRLIGELACAPPCRDRPSLILASTAFALASILDASWA